MLSTSFDPSLGGRSIDWIMAQHFAMGFNKPGFDVTKNKRAWIRLLAEVSAYLFALKTCTSFSLFILHHIQVDKLKRQMSANTSSLPINIECLIEERDFAAAMKRQDLRYTR